MWNFRWVNTSGHVNKYVHWKIWMLYAEWFFIEGEVCQLNGELQVDICTKESYILRYDFDQGFTITSWSKGCFFQRGTSLIRNKLLHNMNTDAFSRESEVIWFHESESKYTLVPGRGYAPAKIFGGLNWCPPIHCRENLDFTPAGIRVAFSYRRTQSDCMYFKEI